MERKMMNTPKKTLILSGVALCVIAITVMIVQNANKSDKTSVDRKSSVDSTESVPASTSVPPLVLQDETGTAVVPKPSPEPPQPYSNPKISEPVEDYKGEKLPVEEVSAAAVNFVRELETWDKDSLATWQSRIGQYTYPKTFPDKIASGSLPAVNPYTLDYMKYIVGEGGYSRYKSSVINFVGNNNTQALVEVIITSDVSLPSESGAENAPPLSQGTTNKRVVLLIKPSYTGFSVFDIVGN